MLNISIEQLIDICGKPTRQSGGQYYFRCPVCSAGGGDSRGNNLMFNAKRGLLKCFACGGERQVLKMLASRNPHFTKPFRTEVSKVKWYEINRKNLYDYYVETLQQQKPYELIRKTWLWTPQVMEDVGYDPNPSHLFPSLTEPSLIFPVFTNNLDLVGIEARAISHKIIKHTKDMPNVLAFFKMMDMFDSLVICEGFKDTLTLIAMYPNMRRNVATPSNGVGSLEQCISSIRLNKYKEIILLLDNDEAGDQVTNKLINKFGSNFKDGRSLLKGEKDVWKLYAKSFETKQNSESLPTKSN